MQLNNPLNHEALPDARLQDAGNATWSTDDLDEAIRTALEQYSKYNPQHVLGTLTLGASDAREIDISSLTGLMRVEKVWWAYDDTDPSFPPNYRQFEVWPGLADGTSALFIDESEEPDSGDVLRIFYTTGNTISGLDSATETTLIDRDVNVLILGASGYLVQERIQEEQVYWGKRDWRDWAAKRLREFEDALHRIAHRQAVKHSGIAPVSDLDRWDADWS